ncbi:MAG: iron-sulfur cluster assembly protein, partial [Chloroflexi bacterium]|nr:iron-sulfur cluster assembly protein [Chloroflexota bacterium]
MAWLSLPGTRTPPAALPGGCTSSPNRATSTWLPGWLTCERPPICSLHSSPSTTNTWPKDEANTTNRNREKAMIREEELRQALAKVTDPELGRSIVELGMVRDIALSDGQVDLTLALTTMACPLKGRIVDDIKSAIRGVDGALLVNIKLAEMTDEEKAKAFGAPPGPHRGESQQKASIAQAFNDIDHVVAVM